MATKGDIQEFLDKVAFYAYWILGMLLVGGGSYYLYNRMNKQVAGVLVFMAGVIALYFYYVKWFLGPDTKWPPIVTTCPDFLTHAGTYDGTGTDAGKKFVYCKDYVGVGSSIKKDGTGIGETNKISSFSTGRAAATAGYAFEIPITVTGTGTSAKESIDAGTVCSEVKSKGLTWMSYCDAL
jgi:hypothetical protein